MGFEIVLSGSSAIIALSALIFSVVSFRKQQDRADSHAATSVKPLLSIRSQNMLKLKSIRLSNFGVGPAVVKKVEFRRSLDDEPTNIISSLFEVECSFDSLTNIPEKRAIPPEGEMLLVKLSQERILEKGFNEEEAMSMLEKWKNQKKDILVYIEYTDIYGNEMEPLNEKLS